MAPPETGVPSVCAVACRVSDQKMKKRECGAVPAAPAPLLFRYPRLPGSTRDTPDPSDMTRRPFRAGLVLTHAPDASRVRLVGKC